MLGRLIVVLGRLDSEKYERIAMFFMILGKIEARLINNSPWLYLVFETVFIGNLDVFADRLMTTFTSDSVIICGEIRLYAVCPWLWQEFRNQGLRKGYRYVNLGEAATINDLPC